MTLVDRNDYHQFQPLLYQVATSQLPAEDIARPHRTIFRDHPTVEVRTADVADIDVATRSLTLSGGEAVTGSHLVIAAGAQPEFFGVPGAAEHAFPLYSVADAERLRLHLQDLVRAVADGKLDEDALDVVVVGGGPTGVEIAGALTELMTALATMGRIPQGRADLPGRPREHAARRVLRQVAQVRAQAAHQAGRRTPAGHGRRGRARRPGGARRRDRHPHPHRHLGRRRVGGLRRAGRRRAQDRPRRAGGRPARPDRRGTPARVRGRRRRQHPGGARRDPAAAGLGRAAVRRLGRRQHPARAQPGSRRSRSTTRTRASWR